MPDSSQVPLLLSTDGGGDGQARGAAAAILNRKALRRRYKIVACLGGVSGSEAEIMGGILGFSLLEYLKNSGELPGSAVRWECDSQYVLKTSQLLLSGGGPGETLPNAGMWSLLLQRLPAFTVDFQHIQGHAGNRANIACDRACSWIQEKGRHFLQEPTRQLGLKKKAESGDAWCLLDLQQVVSLLRENNSEKRLLAAEILSKGMSEILPR